MKVFVDNVLNLPKMMVFVYEKVENIVGKGENAGYQHFLFFQQGFQRAFSTESLKLRIAGKKLGEYVKIHKELIRYFTYGIGVLQTHCLLELLFCLSSHMLAV